MSNFKVYLAGVISGQTFEGATNWRSYAAHQLQKGEWVDLSIEHRKDGYFLDTGIRAYSPMRAHGYLHDMEGMPKDRKETNIKRILQRDHWDCKTSDVILCNLLDVEKVSIGSVMEIAWAYAYGIPLVLVTNKDSVHRHGMLVESTGWVTINLDEGIQMVKDILVV
jgi:nucleoside 2-deoxyribosyltransferase